MKEIWKYLKQIGGKQGFQYYRLIVTPERISLKLIPISDFDDEINYLVNNDKSGKFLISEGLRNIVEKI